MTELGAKVAEKVNRLSTRDQSMMQLSQPKELPRAQVELAKEPCRPFQHASVTYEDGQTRATVVTKDGLPLFGVAYGEDSVLSSLRALQDALGQTHPLVREVLAEPRELPESKAYTKFEGPDGQRWVALGTDSTSVVAGVEYMLLESKK